MEWLKELGIEIWSWVKTKVQEWPAASALLFYILLALVVGLVLIGKSIEVQKLSSLVLGVIGGSLLGIGLGLVVKPGNPYSNITLGAAGSLGVDGLLEREVGGLKGMIVQLKGATLDQLPMISPELVNIWLAYLLLVGIPLALTVSITRWHRLRRKEEKI